jgi:uncharacterized protein (DUF2062 family)
MRIFVLNTVFFFICIFYINPRDFFRHLFRRATYRNLWAELKGSGDPAGIKALSIALGVCMGIMPVWGFQVWIGLALAVFFRLNKALVIVSSNISLPPVIPVIVYLSYQIGRIWMNEPSDAELLYGFIPQPDQKGFLQYLYGSITLALGAGTAAGLLAYGIMRLMQPRNQSTC